MTGAELLYQLVLTWNRLPKPTTESDVVRAGGDLAERFRDREILTDREGYGHYSSILAEFDDPDQELIALLVLEVGNQLHVRFLRFIAHYTLGLVRLDHEHDAAGSLESYEKANNLWFDKLSEQLFFGNIGLTLSHLERYGESIERLQRALELAEERGDDESVGIYYQNMGVAYRFSGRHYSAKECYERALAVSERRSRASGREDPFLSRRRENLKAIKVDIDKLERGISPESIPIIGYEDRSHPEILQYSRPLRVFACHASEDKPQVRDLVDRVKDGTIRVWLDEEEIGLGERWDSTIQHNLEQSDAVIVCITEALVSKSSKDSYVRKEIDLALSLADSGHVLVVPLLLNSCGIPDELSEFQTTDYRASNGHQRLMSALRAHAKRIGIG